MATASATAPAAMAATRDRFASFTRARAVTIPAMFASAQEYYQHLKHKLEELLLERQQIMDLLMARNSPLYKNYAADNSSRSCRFPSYQLSSSHKLRKYVLRREASRTVDKSIDHVDQQLRLLERMSPADALEDARQRLRHMAPHHPAPSPASSSSSFFSSAAFSNADLSDRLRPGTPQPRNHYQPILKPAFAYKPSNKRFVVSAPAVEADASPSATPCSSFSASKTADADIRSINSKKKMSDSALKTSLPSLNITSRTLPTADPPADDSRVASAAISAPSAQVSEQLSIIQSERREGSTSSAAAAEDPALINGDLQSSQPVAAAVASTATATASSPPPLLVSFAAVAAAAAAVTPAPTTPATVVSASSTPSAASATRPAKHGPTGATTGLSASSVSASVPVTSGPTVRANRHRVANARAERPPPMDSESFMSLFNVSIVNSREASADTSKKMLTISPSRRSRMRNSVRRREVASNAA